MNNFIDLSESQDVMYGDTKKVLLKKGCVELLKNDTKKKVSKITDSVGTIFDNLNNQKDFIRYDGDSRIFVKFNNCKTFYYIYGEFINESYKNLDGNINLVSGMCLFDAKSVVGTKENLEQVSLVSPYTDIDQKIIDISIYSKLTIYEAETITRILSLIKNIDESKIENFGFQIPYIEYMFYLTDAYNSGFLNKELYLKYIQELENKKDNIISIVKNRLSEKLNEKFNLECPLENIKEFLIEKIINNNKIELDGIVNILKKDFIFNKIFTNDPPNSFKDIVYKSYIYVYIKNSFTNDMVAIENSSEITILRNVKKIVNDFGINNSISGIYSQPVIIPSDGNFSYFSTEKSSIFNIKNACSLYLNKY